LSCLLKFDGTLSLPLLNGHLFDYEEGSLPAKQV
jgi:hypothetical protein